MSLWGSIKKGFGAKALNGMNGNVAPYVTQQAPQNPQTPQALAGALRQFDPSMSFQQRRQQIYQPQPVQPQAMPQNVGMVPPQRVMQGGFSYR